MGITGRRMFRSGRYSCSPRIPWCDVSERPDRAYSRNIFPTDKNDQLPVGYARAKVEVPRVSSIDEVTAAS
ncbi:hypothetical protein JG688_00010773 [Phytophthora aleatoria]|uniref:Uncharacterized protein n=1 Tax=Phytophthora aleatoria TaxID=2496075 RepID=A0A8J5M342_9STRA|nr:hypothetical protein JG688_00010773 [Phytophthora aleatoria]